ncbi:MAG: carbohydrate ABC transporter permease [Actinomycetota bacterium]|nr:carbohydrate ABC transporter permease [Actinomycetota bacterium]
MNVTHLRPRRALVHVVVIAICALWLIPTLALLVSAFRPADQVATTGWWTALRTPFDLTFENFREVLGRRGMGRAFLNSLLIALPATVIPITVAAFAGFALARMRFRGGSVAFAALVGLLVVPIQVTLVPVLRLLEATGLTGTFVGIWAVHAGFTLPFAIYLLRNFFASLPAELFEAAEIDGASPLQSFVLVALPTSTPALASLAIFQFLWVWNDLLSALIFLGGGREVAPLTVALSNLVSSRGEGWQTLTAAAFVSTALPVAVFLAMQRYFVRGLLSGTVKG